VAGPTDVLPAAPLLVLDVLEELLGVPLPPPAPEPLLLVALVLGSFGVSLELEQAPAASAPAKAVPNSVQRAVCEARK